MPFSISPGFAGTIYGMIKVREGAGTLTTLVNTTSGMAFDTLSSGKGIEYVTSDATNGSGVRVRATNAGGLLIDTRSSSASFTNKFAMALDGSVQHFAEYYILQSSGVATFHIRALDGAKQNYIATDSSGNLVIHQSSSGGMYFDCHADGFIWRSSASATRMTLTDAGVLSIPGIVRAGNVNLGGTALDVYGTAVFQTAALNDGDAMLALNAVDPATPGETVYTIKASGTSTGSFVDRLFNNGTGANSHAYLDVCVHASGGDPFITFSENGGEAWAVGYDNSANRFAISNYWGLVSTLDRFRIDSSTTNLVSIVASQATTTFAGLGGILTQNYADVGNVGTGEDDLHTYTVPASVLGTNGDKIEAEYMVVLAAHATATRQVRAYFAGTATVDSTALTLASGGTATVKTSIIRESSTVVRVSTTFTVNGITSQPVVTYTRITGLTLSSTNVLKITGEAAGVGAATDDLICKMSVVKFFPNI